ncbi:hypothetical protein ACWD4L_08475 [Streptomyces sp. NPDC002596]|uniref:hypothetical protein n=1 Tax=Streptomyces sp. NPDC056227 TaxID=3345753 RepID=UPI0035DA7172
MSFDQEWAELRQAAQTRLNSAGPGHGGLPDVKINASGKTAAVNALETQIQPGVRKAGVMADDSTTGAVTAFTGWQTGSGLKDAQAEWEKQVESLQGRLARDKEALRQTRGGFQYVDHEIKGDMGKIAALSPETDGR